jgi:YrbI family 3-deoxy-D-manno-octulosonate 8-phosphate phosphatase
MRWVALLPLRAGSKSIPGKNLRLIAGQPLYAWSLAAAVESQIFDHIYVASDSAAIRDDVRARFGGAVEAIDRAPDNATDTASSESVMQEFAGSHSFDVLALIQATSPLTRAEDFKAARQQFETERLDSLLTAVRTRRFFWTDKAQPLNYDPNHRPRRQDFNGLLMENGAFYFTSAPILAESGSRLGGHVGIHVMHEDSAVELDEPPDWEWIEGCLRRRLRSEFRARDIRALVLDVDGTLTDAGMYYGAGGEALKKFNTRDAKGLLLLAASGVRICVMTAENSPAVHSRMRKLGITDYHAGVTDKAERLRERLRAWNLAPSQVAVIGDDLNDISCMRLAGAVFCPLDAQPEVRAIADYVCAANAGEGAVREVCDLLRASVSASVD